MRATAGGMSAPAARMRTVWVAPPHSRTSRLPGLREAGTGVAALRFNGSASFRPEGSQGRPYGMASGLAVSGRWPLAPRRQPKSQFYDTTPKSCRGLRRHISLQIYDRVSSPSTRNVGGSKFMLKLALRQNPGKCVPAAQLMTGVAAAQHFERR